MTRPFLRPHAEVDLVERAHYYREESGTDFCEQFFHAAMTALDAIWRIPGAVSEPGCREKISQFGLVLSSDQKDATPESEETASLRMFVPKKFYPYPRGLCLLDNQLAFKDRRTNLNTNNVRHGQTLRQPTNRVTIDPARRRTSDGG